MKALAVDCSSNECSISVSAPGGITASQVWERNVDLGEPLVGSVERLLCRTGLKASELELLAVSAGPGSFTGIRAGLNLVKAISYVTGAPIFSINTLDLWTHSVQPNGQPCGESVELVTILNAFGRSVFWSTHIWSRSRWVPGVPPTHSDLVNFERLFEERRKESKIDFAVTGDAGAYYPELHSYLQAHGVSFCLQNQVCRAQILSELAVASCQTGSTFAWNEAQPIYIRLSGAEEKMTKVRRDFII